ncbi:uncharacterized protein LOC109404084 [Aedes albopictus]|uniref:MADF domain-containing protein n=1 Tax=Aedes albopictus TaxID=7160 RepID=A0ABM2A214_AEDAL
MAKNNHLLIKSDVNKDEQLIALVEQNPVLYTQTHPKYMDSKYKQKVWDTIGAFIEEDTLACKARWYNIRDNYRKSIRNNLTRSGSKKAKLYKYTEQLSFLSNYVEELMRDHVTINNDDQETRSTLPSPTPPDEEPTVENEEYLEDAIMKEEVTFTDNEYSKDPLTTLEATPSTRQTTLVDKPSASKDTRSSKIVRRVMRPVYKRVIHTPGNQYSATTVSTAEPSTSESANRVMEMLAKKVISTAESHDPVDAFLAGLSPTLKTLHPIYQNLAKSEIFATVQKYEIKQLTEPSPSSTVFFTDQQARK